MYRNGLNVDVLCVVLMLGVGWFGERFGFCWQLFLLRVVWKSWLLTVVTSNSQEGVQMLLESA